MTTTLETDWTTYARRLADTLRDNGDLRCPAWHAAVAAVPRHLLVPHAFEQDSTGTWSEFTTADAPQRVYSPETLITALDTVGTHQQPISSSTKPDLMVRMLEILDIQDGHRVLEIGTGTGYNAALLAHRLGDDRVSSVEVDSGLVDLARGRLAAAGFRPTLVATDGAAGLPEHAPFDRIIATCSVPAIPWAWAEQLTDGGAILADLKLAISAGNLVHLHRAHDHLEGRFTSRWAAFMAIRSGPTPIPQPEPTPPPAAASDPQMPPPSDGKPRPWPGSWPSSGYPRTPRSPTTSTPPPGHRPPSPSPPPTAHGPASKSATAPSPKPAPPRYGHTSNGPTSNGPTRASPRGTDWD